MYHRIKINLLLLCIKWYREKLNDSPFFFLSLIGAWKVEFSIYTYVLRMLINKTSIFTNINGKGGGEGGEARVMKM